MSRSCSKRASGQMSCIELRLQGVTAESANDSRVDSLRIKSGSEGCNSAGKLWIKAGKINSGANASERSGGNESVAMTDALMKSGCYVTGATSAAYTESKAPAAGAAGSANDTNAHLRI